MRVTTLLTVSVLSLAALPACNSSSSAPPAAATAAAAASTPPVAPTPSAAAPAAAGSAAANTGADPLVGKPAPDFTAAAQDGPSVPLAALKGKPVVIYFYPKDETPGCTKEACSFRDSWDALAKKGVVMIGVSADTDDSHKAFAKNHKLPFLLVSDPDGKLAASFGVPF